MIATLTRRQFLRRSAVSAALAASGTVLYTWGIEPYWLELVAWRMPIPNLPEALRGARLVQISDLHIGPQVDDEYLLRCLAEVKALAPEIAVFHLACAGEDLNLHGISPTGS